MHLLKPCLGVSDLVIHVFKILTKTKAKTKTKYYWVLQIVTACYRLSKSIKEYNRVLQSITKTKTNLAHLLGPFFGLGQSNLILQICTCCFFAPRCFGMLLIFCLVEVAGIFNFFIVKNSISKLFKVTISTANFKNWRRLWNMPHHGVQNWTRQWASSEKFWAPSPQSW